MSFANVFLETHLWRLLDPPCTQMGRGLDGCGFSSFPSGGVDQWNIHVVVCLRPTKRITSMTRFALPFFHIGPPLCSENAPIWSHWALHSFRLFNSWFMRFAGTCRVFGLVRSLQCAWHWFKVFFIKAWRYNTPYIFHSTYVFFSQINSSLKIYAFMSKPMLKRK